MPGRLTPRAARLAVVAGCATLVAACAGGDPGPGSSPSAGEVPDLWRAQIDQVLADDPDDFTREALSDHRITDAEYAQARQLERECIEDSGPGLDVVLPPGGGVDVGRLDEFTRRFDSEAQADAAVTEIMDRCGQLPSSHVQQLYVGMQQNPRGLTIPQMIRGCFEANGVPDGAGLSDDEFAALVFDDAYVPGDDAAASCTSDYLEPWDNRGGTPAPTG